MTAPTAAQIEAAALAAASAFPLVAQYVRAGDPRVLAQIRAAAAMLAMVAEHVDNAQFEPFVKTRDSTVLADATLKGILPLARPCRVNLTVTNGDASDFTLSAGRRLLDPGGRVFTVDADVIVTAGNSSTVAATQSTVRTIEHVVQNPTAFYRIEVVPADADVYLSQLAVAKGATDFAYVPEWFNVQAGETAYQVETDERRRLYVCMGSGAVGYTVQAGDTFTITLSECEGKITDIAAGAEFSLEYVYTAADGKQKLVLSQVTDQGAAPHSAAELRVMAEYPSIYDHNAVYLGEFAFLLRRYLSGIEFLSVWNEQIEEDVRGASVANINRLFVAGRVDGMTAEAFEAQALELITRADDSYKVTFVEVLDWPTQVSISAKVAVVHDPATVAAQIRGAVLANYGAGSAAVSVGMSNPLRVQAMTKVVKDAVPALQDSLSDFEVVISPAAAILPEMFLHVTDDSLEVTVERADFNSGLWNH